MAKSKQIASAIFLSFTLFPFYIKGLELLTQALIYGGSIVIILFSLPALQNAINFNGLKKNFVIFILISLFVIDAIILIGALYCTNDYNYLYSYLSQIRMILRITAALVIIQKIIIKKNITDIEYISLCTTAICIYVVTTLILLIPTLRMAWLNIISITETNEDLTNAIAYYTRFGLQGFSGFMHTCICNIGILLLLSKSNIIKRDIIKIIIMLIGCVCYGRIGLLGSILIITLFFMRNIFSGRGLKIFKYLIIISLILTILISANYDSLKSEPRFFWAFEPIIKLLEKGSFESSSSNELKEMWFIPGLKSILFGDGFYINPNGSYYMQTDVGFLRLILFGGIFFTLLIYIFNIWPITTLWKNNIHNKLLLYGSIILIIMFEMKGEAIGYFSAIFFPFYFTRKTYTKLGTI